LRHKDWHVWNRENVEKVLVDERKHREKQEKERHRQEQIASERRRNLLRARKSGAGEPSKTDGVAMNSAPSDVLDDEELPSLGGFQVREAMDFPPPTVTKNAEYESEMKAKRDKFEKEYLKRYMAEDHVAMPWYAAATSTIDAVIAAKDDDEEKAVASEATDSGLDDDGTTKAGEAREARAKLRAKAESEMKKKRSHEEEVALKRRKQTQAAEDPMRSMLHKKPSDKPRSDKHVSKDKSISAVSDKDKKHEKKTKKRRNSQSSSSSSSQLQTSSIEKLRQERLAREREAKVSLQKIIYADAQNVPSKPADERALPYNTAFNARRR